MKVDALQTMVIGVGRQRHSFRNGAAFVYGKSARAQGLFAAIAMRTPPSTVSARKPRNFPHRKLTVAWRKYVHHLRHVGTRDEGVTFTWKDYSRNCRPKRMTLAPAEFMRGVLLHVARIANAPASASHCLLVRDK